MNLKDFKAGYFKQQLQYKSFYPTTVDRQWLVDDPKINVLLEKATQLLGELNAFSLIVPDVDLFIRMHIVKEANSSSGIEGTQTSIDEAVMKKEEIAPEKRDDWQEVRNYVDAINYAVGKLAEFPLSNRLLRDTHSILMAGVRGGRKYPGEFRVSQNWIGGSNLSDAVFIPPHPDDVPGLMGDLEKFWHDEEIDVPHLIKIAISHYQFETIHPFLDRNGRIGRLLITLYLVNHQLLAKPTLYLSDFFEKHRPSYYDALSRVRESNDLIHWLKFFLNAVITTSDKGKNTFIGIFKLRETFENRILTLGRKTQNAKKLLQFLYSKPIVTVQDVQLELKISERTARDMLQEMIRLELLQEVTGYKRNRVFSFKSYLDFY
ncbi:MAG: Fic family protein [Candidatus Aminicenantes bacterium]|nr:Fic family protein [Candidatus Aminicenantes bacterium]